MNSWSVAEMLASLRSGRATSRQLVEIAVDRARQCATDLNAFAAISDTATASAVASDRKYREGTARKLEGTPAVSRLLPTLEEIPFPELFSARTFIGDQPPVCPHVKS